MDKLLTSPAVMLNTVYLASVIFIISTIIRAVVDTFFYHIRYKNIKTSLREIRTIIEKPVSKKKTVIKKSN